LWPYAKLLGEDTHLTDYAKGCRALRFFGWQKAAFWFREALAARSDSFGNPVPWTGGNSQLYLPRYTLGVSLFGLGDYDGALEEWQRAEKEWSSLDAVKQRALKPYFAVLHEGRDIYRNVVCAELIDQFDSGDGSKSAGGKSWTPGTREEIRTLCYEGHFAAAVKRARALAYTTEGASDRPVPDSSNDPEKVEIVENVPVAFAQEVSDCEAPDNLKPLANVTTPKVSQNIEDDRHPVPLRAVIGASVPRANLAASHGQGETVTGGPVMTDLVKSVERIYSKKSALLISPDYKGTPWGNIKGAEEAIQLLESGLLRWGFKKEDIVWLHGYVKSGDLEQQIRSFIHANAAHGDHERHLVLIHFLGHAYRQDDSDNGVLIASDSPFPHGPRDIRALMEKSVEAGIVMSFTNQSPHHLIFSFDSCSFGEHLLLPFEGMRAIAWNTAQKNPALLFVARAGPEQIVSAKPALTEALGHELRECGHADLEGVATGWSLFTAVAQDLFSKEISDTQTLKYGLAREWKNGDVVLRVPTDCQPATKGSHPRPTAVKGTGL
jgi:tetratricopeptide (TPR) repeat protein